MKFGNEFWLILFWEYISPNLFAVWAARAIAGRIWTVEGSTGTAARRVGTTAG